MTDAYRVMCGHCGERIVGCWGEHGSWKHYDTNREHCADGNLAAPGLPAVRRKGRQRRWDVGSKTKATHGMRARYQAGCRCEDCKAANKRYLSARRRKAVA